MQQIDFFDNPHKVTTYKSKFGICDDVAAKNCPRNPAYIDDSNPDKWTAEVTNEENKKVSFYPIDNCIEILRSDGKPDNRCDGMLHYNNCLLFIELKDRAFTRKWVQEGLLQLEVTYKHFANNHDITKYSRISAQLCNKQRPQAVISCKSAIEEFKDKTGVIVKVDRNIYI